MNIGGDANYDYEIRPLSDKQARGLSTMITVEKPHYRPQRTAAGAQATISDDLESRLLTLSEMEGGAVIEMTSGKRTPEQQQRTTGRPQSASQHVIGDAADIKIVGKAPSEAADVVWNSGLFSTVAEYSPQAGGHIHVDQNRRGGKSRRYKTDRSGNWTNRVDERD